MSSHPKFRFRMDMESAGSLSRSVRQPAAKSASDPFKLERRCEKRHAAEGTLCASYSDGAHRFGITHLELVDRSPRGLRARTHVRIEPGETVTICPEGSTIPWVSAKAVRCVESDGAFVVGLRYCASAMAA